MASNKRAALLGAHMGKMTKPSELRPVLTSLNGDNSWLMSFPVPPDEGPTATKHRKVYYHIVFDPWFQSSGAAVTVASWIIWAALTAQSTIQNGDDVEQIAREIELSAAKAGLVAGNEEPGGGNERMVDAIVISSRVTDHLHEESLRQFDRRIPVVAVPDAAVILNGWDYFDTVVSMQDMGGDDGSEWQGLHPRGPLPGWLTPFRLRESALNFAIVIVWSRGLVDIEVSGAAAAQQTPQHEALWVSPHGMHLEQPPLQAFLRDTTKTVNVLAMLHPLKEGFTWGWNTVLGVTGGLAVERALGGPKYWIPTANAALSYWGLFMLRVQDIPRSMEWGLAKEERIAREKGEAVVERRPNLVQVKSGESLVLE
ncbi:hypothetical protein PG985_005935 [Apiospora marii]|uniref:Uncharacterized protein n=1 Tax=Apiospora marii TaxID=335849 RepID=A0ABR1SDB4_9PEZI